MVKLKRRTSKTDYGCKYEIILDEKNIGFIENGEEVGLEPQKGMHKLQIKGPQFKSNIVKFEVINDEIISFECYPLYTENKLTKIIFKFIFSRVGIELVKSKDIYL